jgi:glutamate mutase epsilon subunit
MEPPSSDPWVRCEQDLPRSAIGELETAGFRIVPAAPTDRALGHAMLLRIEDGSLRAASDPRSDAGALAS